MMRILPSALMDRTQQAVAKRALYSFYMIVFRICQNVSLVIILLRADNELQIKNGFLHNLKERTYQRDE
jgi:hypothetical protein